MKKLITMQCNCLSKSISKTKAALATAFVATLATTTLAGPPPQSVARQWNETLLNAIRHDFARPTVHARNLYHTSVAMWDAWAAYDNRASTHLHHETAVAPDVEAARNVAISYAIYRVLKARFADSPGAAASLASFDARMAELGYDASYTSTAGTSPAALGNRIAATILAFGLLDGATTSQQ